MMQETIPTVQQQNYHKHTCISCGKSFDCTTEKNQYDGVTICPAKDVNYFCSRCQNKADKNPTPKFGETNHEL